MSVSLQQGFVMRLGLWVHKHACVTRHRDEAGLKQSNHTEKLWAYAWLHFMSKMEKEAWSEQCSLMGFTLALGVGGRVY